MAERKTYYTFNRIKAPRISIDDIQRAFREINDNLEALSLKTYGNIEENDLHDNLAKKIKSKVDKTTYETYIDQTAQTIELLATKEEVADSLSDFSGGLAALSDAVDGKTTTFFLDSEPLSAAINDIWYELDTDKIWKKIADGTGIDKWQDITTTALKAALQAAATAQATADGKIVSYYQDDMPAGTDYAVGDLWFDTNDKNKMYRWSGTAWVSAQDTHLDSTVSTHTTQIQQNADAIALKANQTTVDALGNTVSSLSAELDLVPGQITAEVTNKTVHVSDTPPSGAGLYIGRIWQDTLTNEQLRWKGIVANNARSYVPSPTPSGASVSFDDLSDKLALGLTAKTVSTRAGRGAPEPTPKNGGYSGGGTGRGVKRRPTRRNGNGCNYGLCQRQHGCGHYRHQQARRRCGSGKRLSV